ncbi:DNA cytosine methyltransferase [Kineococcus rhizosphaerae]|nr:DNA cytosine methyltransferase [Kineococcus rhizosphaerae]
MLSPVMSSTPSLPQVKVVDLFCGAGGLTIGFEDAGLDVAVASDFWHSAAETHRINFPSIPFIEADIRDVTPADIKSHCGGLAPDVVAGGPPCQGFSSAGARSEIDIRNTLVRHYAKLAVELEPSVIVFENVEGFLTAGGGAFVVDLIDPLVEAGYSIRLEKLNVAHFGVPQLRKRVIAIASRGRTPAQLEPSHSASGAPGVWRRGIGLPYTRTVGDALARTASDLADELNVPRKSSELERKRIEALKPGQTMRDLDSSLHHASYARRANRRVGDGMPTEKRGGAPAGLRRLVSGEPSKAITSAAVREFVHPTENRMITLREAAILQTFPADFHFSGNRSEIATMIGNAIPAAFAAALGSAVLETLKRPPGDVRGELIDFIVTHAEAMSPALAKTVRLVNQRYSSTSGQPSLFS